jgi:hypothetical protein
VKEICEKKGSVCGGGVELREERRGREGAVQQCSCSGTNTGRSAAATAAAVIKHKPEIKHSNDIFAPL